MQEGGALQAPVSVSSLPCFSPFCVPSEGLCFPHLLSPFPKLPMQVLSTWRPLPGLSRGLLHEEFDGEVAAWLGLCSAFSARLPPLCGAHCFHRLLSFLPVCVRVGRLALFSFILTPLKNKLQSAKNLAFPSCWLGADTFPRKGLDSGIAQEAGSEGVRAWRYSGGAGGAHGLCQAPQVKSSSFR